MAKEEDRFSGREKGIQAYHQALSAAAKKSRDQGSSAWKGRNARRIRQAREDRTLNRRPRWDERLGQGIANAGRDLGDMSVDIKEKITDWMPQGAKEKFAGIPHWFAQNLGRNFEEVEAAKRDDDEFTWGGDPIAADRGSPAYKFLLNQMEDKNAFREAVGDDKVFYTGLEEMSGDKYDASHPGLIALLNDPSRLKDMSPVRALNYMRSITGEPSNMGFDEFEALRQSQPKTYGGLDATGIAKQLLPEYYAQANDMYGQGFIGNTAAATYGDTSEVPAHIKQATGIPPVDIERLRLQGKGGHQDLTTIAPKADEIFDQTISANIAPANEILTESLEPTTPTVFRPRQEGLDWDISPEEQELLMSVYGDPELKALQKGPAFAYDETDENVNNWADYTLTRQTPSWGGPAQEEYKYSDQWPSGWHWPEVHSTEDPLARDPWRTSGPEEVEDWLGIAGPAIDEYAEYGYDPFNNKIIPR